MESTAKPRNFYYVRSQHTLAKLDVELMTKPIPRQKPPESANPSTGESLSC